MADDPLENLRLCENSLQKLGSRRQFLHIFGVPETIRHDARWDNNRVIGPEGRIVHSLEAFITIEGIFVIIRIPAWQFPEGTIGMTLASATRNPSTPYTFN